MIILIEENTSRPTALQPGDTMTYRKSDGLLRFLRQGDRLNFHPKMIDEGISFPHQLSVENFQSFATIIATLANLGLANTFRDKKEYFAIEFA